MVVLRSNLFFIEGAVMATTKIVEAVNRLLSLFEGVPDELPPETTDETVADAINAVCDELEAQDADAEAGIPAPAASLISPETAAGAAVVSAALAQRYGYGNFRAANAAAARARGAERVRTDAEVRRDLLARGIKTFPRIQPK